MGTEMKRCVIIAASPEADLSFIAESVSHDDYVICADAGYKAAFKAGVTPDAVIGDFDSSDIPESGDITVLPVEKDHTDTMGAALLGIKRGYKNFLILNALGGRLDHTLNNLYTLLFIDRLGAGAVIESKTEKIMLLKKGEHKFSGLKGLTLSVFPFGGDRVVLSYKGLKYPLRNYTLTSDNPIASSNIAQSDDVRITVHDGTALIVINKE